MFDVTQNTFVYLALHIRQLNVTSEFTSYTKENFDDNSQKKLGGFL